MKNILDRYLKVMMREAKRYGVDPLFVRTRPSKGLLFLCEDLQTEDSIYTTYESPILGKGRNRRIFRFTFRVVGKVTDEKKFVKPENAVAYDYDKAFHAGLGTPSGSPQVELEFEEPDPGKSTKKHVDFNINKEKLIQGYNASEHKLALKIGNQADERRVYGPRSKELDKLESDLKKLELDIILRGMIQMYALGIGEYIRLGK